MIGFARTDRSALGQWWWTVDRWTLAAVIALMFIGAILVLAASPAVAVRIGLDSFYLVRHHYMMLPLAAITLIGVSVLSPRQVRRTGVVLFGFFLVLTLLTLFSGVEIKGATRWINVGPLSMQPSEFLKPCFAIFTAWMFALQKSEQRIPGNLIAIGAYLVTVAIVIKQPDLGMTVVLDRDLGGAVLRRRPADLLGRVAGRLRRRRPGRRLLAAAARDRARRSVHRSCFRRQLSDRTVRWRPSAMAASPGVDPAAAR